MKDILMTLIALLLSGSILGQTDTLLHENFDATSSGLPPGWTQNQTDNNCLEWGAVLDFSNNGYLMSNNGQSTACNGEDAWVQSPFVDLTQVSNPMLKFGIGISDFAGNWQATTITLWYNIGAGWNYLSNYGQAGSGATNTITGFNTFTPIITDTVTYNLSALSGESNIRFSWGYPNPGNGAQCAFDDVLIFGETITSVQTESALDIFEIYPNPSNDQTELRLKNKTSGVLTLRDVQGKALETQEVESQATLNLSEYPKGLYLVEVKTKKGLFVQRLLKQ